MLTLAQEAAVSISPVHEAVRDFRIATEGYDYVEPNHTFTAQERFGAGLLFLLPGGNSGEVRLAEQGRDALGRFMRTEGAHLPPGALRQQRVEQKLVERFGRDAVQPEQYLRTSNGVIAIDPVTGEGRRIDLAVIRNQQAVGTVEVTSKTAPKGAQAAKELRIRQNGGTFILDRSTEELIDFSTAPAKTSRRK
jgi:hypothetical protein